MDLEETSKKIQRGDFATLGLMLGISGEAARMRYCRPVKTVWQSRKNEEAKEMMLKIIKTREDLINENKPKEIANQ